MKKIIRYISVLLCVTLMLCGMTVAVSAESEYPGDPMVYLTQVWLNQQYGGVTGFGFVTENGKGEGKFDPQGTGTRAEASVIFTKFHKEYLVK